MPRSRIAGAIKRLKLSQKEMKCVAGNSFHLALFGTWAMYVLSNVHKHPRSIPLPVMATEYGTLRSDSGFIEDQEGEDDERSILRARGHDGTSSSSALGPNVSSAVAAQVEAPLIESPSRVNTC